MAGQVASTALRRCSPTTVSQNDQRHPGGTS